MFLKQETGAGDQFQIYVFTITHTETDIQYQILAL